MKKWCKLLLLLICIQKCLFQSILFPHGYFDDKKLTAIDAFYLHMIAIATLENGGITEEELDNLAAIRKPSDSEIEEGQLIPDVKETKPNNTKIPDLDDDEIKQLLNKQRPLIPGSKPKAPFKSRVRRKEKSDDEDFNPFEDIATRAPPITHQQRVLTRPQILGISPSKPRHHVGVPHEDELSEQGWTHPRRRKPYIDIDLTKAHIVQLPIPPP